MNPLVVLGGLGALALMLGSKKSAAAPAVIIPSPVIIPPPPVPTPGTPEYVNHVPGTSPYLQEGYTGAVVAELQGILNSYGNTLETNGVFGPATTSAVKSFQATHLDRDDLALVVDGKVGEKTWWSLRNSPYEYGPPAPTWGNMGGSYTAAPGAVSGLDDNDADNTYLQALELTAHLESVPKYKEDKQMVAAYQAASGLPPNGKYGPGTALRVASCGVVPVPPYYWSKGSAATQKAGYRASILNCEQQYPELAWQPALIERAS